MKHSLRIWSTAVVGLMLVSAGCGSEDDADEDAGASPDAPSSSANAGATEQVVFADGAQLESGVSAYDEFELSTGATVRLTLTPPADGWYVHLGGPQRGVNVDVEGPGDQWTGLLWYEAKGVYQQPCGDEPIESKRFEPLTDSLGPLADRPWTTQVVERPETEMLGGYEAEHAALRLDQCKGDHPNPIVTGGEVGPLPGGDVFDIWLVPLPEAKTSIVVFDPTGLGRGAFSEEWRQAIDSLEITVAKS